MKLNKSQREAVNDFVNNLLIIAGPGTGKTRVISERIISLIQNGIDANRILGLTFTNKAASEMQKRVYTVVGKKPLLTTFHSFCAGILRENYEKAHLNRNFHIFDEADQLSLIKDICSKLEVNVSASIIHSKIMYSKEYLIDSVQFSLLSVNNPAIYDDITARVFTRYDNELKKLNAVDFGDLLIYTVNLFLENPQILEKYRNRFLFIHVDEFQDVNKAQYALLKLLYSGKNNVCVVGDEDQCIYTWRGADPKNILKFESEFKPRTIYLDITYRMTENILNASMNLIRNNKVRKNKVLKSINPPGEEVKILEFEDELSEAMGVCEIIKGLGVENVAVLYRTNAQSRAIEEALIKNKIKYRIFGFLRFFERAIVKSVISYLRFVADPDDFYSFKRISQFPPKGIGEKTIKDIESLLEKYKLSQIIKNPYDFGFSTKAIKGLESLREILDDYGYKDNLYAYDVLSGIIKKSSILEYFEKNEDTASYEAISHINEVLNIAHEKGFSVREFLDYVSLLDAHDEVVDDGVCLMTLHLAKGLEFDAVIITGAEEGLLPLQGDIEEERRLMYVGMTRARKNLFITYSNTRFIFGRKYIRSPSRFIDEILAEDFKCGEVVEHPDFGVGMIKRIIGRGEEKKAIVEFKDATRKLLLKYSKLKKIDGSF